MTPGLIDVHFHLIPQFYRDAVYEAGNGPAIGRYPDWTPALALDLMDNNGIALALLSLGQPGVGFMPKEKAAAFARRCNDYAAELIAQHPKRFGCFGLLPMHDIGLAIAEAQYCLDTLNFEGISLFASYGGTFLGDTAFDPLLHYLDARNTVVHIHPSLHPSSKSLDLPWPGFMIEYPFDTTRAAVNLLFSGALERFPNIKFILSHAGGTLPSLAWAAFCGADDRQAAQAAPARGHLSPGFEPSGTTTRWPAAPHRWAHCRRSPRPSASCSAATGRFAVIVW